jgi:hypothetical protein
VIKGLKGWRVEWLKGYRRVEELKGWRVELLRGRRVVDSWGGWGWRLKVLRVLTVLRVEGVGLGVEVEGFEGVEGWGGWGLRVLRVEGVEGWGWVEGVLKCSRVEGLKAWRVEGLTNGRVEGLKDWRVEGGKGWRLEGLKGWRVVLLWLLFLLVVVVVLLLLVVVFCFWSFQLTRRHNGSPTIVVSAKLELCSAPPPPAAPEPGTAGWVSEVAAVTSWHPWQILTINFFSRMTSAPRPQTTHFSIVGSASFVILTTNWPLKFDMRASRTSSKACPWSENPSATCEQ